MSIWRLMDGVPEQLPTTELRHEHVLEQDLEDWIVARPELLGEPLLLIGRQVVVPDTKDRLDLLALDTAGNAVIIELKRGHLKGPVDVQALRYASYVSKWNFDDFEEVARKYHPGGAHGELSLNEIYENFCEGEGDGIKREGGTTSFEIEV